MKLYRTKKGNIVETEGKWFEVDANWADIVNDDDCIRKLKGLINKSVPSDDLRHWVKECLLPPAFKQEIWAAGVTYFRSKKARIEESQAAGGGDFYDKVYDAPRPELFFKCPWYRAVTHGEHVRVRKDASWNVPEPELTLVITSNKKIIGYTIGNDMSSRDIEGENPLYLPQAKTYNGSAAIGPCILLTESPIDKNTLIEMSILRQDKEIFSGSTSIGQMKRQHSELVNYLFKELSFKNGVLLMTGTGIIPPDNFSLEVGDRINISIGQIGTLSNIVGDY